MFCLTHPTDARWAERAADELDRVLVDHAHCEMKAASNALSLATRSFLSRGAVRRLVELAREELAHFDEVLQVLEERGLELGPPPVDEYASELRRLAAATGKTSSQERVLVDRLLVGALIEARSCERFKLLAEELGRRGLTGESAFYRELMTSEARHYTTRRALAIEVCESEEHVAARLAALAAIEASVVAGLDGQPTIHG